jgi:hypothetical protein
VLFAAKPEDIGFAVDDPMPPTMSPLRVVVSRGHIAGKLLNAGFLRGKPAKDLAFATPAFPLAPEPSPAKRQDFLLALAIRDAGDVAACTSRAATSLS